MRKTIKLKIDNHEFAVKLAQNAATAALVDRLRQGDVVVQAHGYGSFEQVGDLGFSLPTDDAPIATKPGDLMLYQGNQVTLFYGSNSWSYTKLGEIANTTQAELKNILGEGDAVMVLSLE